MNAIGKGYSSNLIKIKPENPAFIESVEFTSKKIKEYLPENEKNWRLFHFSNFELPLPIDNPVVQLYPLTTRLGKYDIFGGNINNDKGRIYFSFTVGLDYSFIYPLDKQKVFSLPIFKEFLEKIPKEKIFELVFTKPLDIKNLDINQRVKALRKLWGISYYELVLNLFILQIRNDLFPKNAIKFSYYPEKKLGVVEQEDKNSGFYKETIFLLEKDKIYTLEWRLPKEELLSDNIRFRFLNNLKFKGTYTEAFISAFNDYRSLPLYKKITSTSFTILYSGLTHDPGNQNILKAITRDLKRGKGNEKFLEWLYDYGEKKLKVNLRIDQDAIDAARIEKEKAEKLEKELREASKLRTPTSEEETEDLTKEEKVELLLKDAKDKGEEIEQSDKALIEN